MEKTPASKISSGHTYVDSEQALDRLIERLQNTNRVGIDTEADSLHHYFEKVCLIQLSFSGDNYIVDPLAGYSLSEFLEVLSQKELIFQGANYDLLMLKKSFGFEPKAPVFDTMLAAQVLGYEKIGLAALVEKFFGVSMSKAGQKADWSKRPLPAALLTYASDDTKYLEALADAMTEHLQKLDRIAWHRECCERVVKTSLRPEKDETKEPWRVKGSSKMPPHELIFLRELWKWRDTEARKRDVPPFYILHTEDLIKLAEWRTQNPQTPLRQGPPFLKRFSGENFARLENAIQTADHTPQSEWPLPPKKIPWSGKTPDKEKLEALIVACKTLAKTLAIDASFLASRAALTAVVLDPPSSIEKMVEISGLMNWQAELVMSVIKPRL